MARKNWFSKKKFIYLFIIFFFTWSSSLKITVVKSWIFIFVCDFSKTPRRTCVYTTTVKIFLTLASAVPDDSRFFDCTLLLPATPGLLCTLYLAIYHGRGVAGLGRHQLSSSLAWHAAIIQISTSRAVCVSCVYLYKYYRRRLVHNTPLLPDAVGQACRHGNAQKVVPGQLHHHPGKKEEE